MSAQRLPTARRGSVQWDNMDESTAAVTSDSKEIHHIYTVAEQKQLSKWVPIEFCEIAFIPGIPSANKRGHYRFAAGSGAQEKLASRDPECKIASLVTFHRPRHRSLSRPSRFS